MRPDRNCSAIGFAATIPQIPNQFFARIELSAGRLIAVKISDQTDAERDVVQEITVDMAAIDLPAPSIAHFDLPVSGRSAVTNDKMIGKTILHPANVAMIIIKDAGITLASAAIVHDDEFPPIAHNRRPSYLVDHGSTQIMVVRWFRA